jgi:phosphatidylglycerophosphate synthase
MADKSSNSPTDNSTASSQNSQHPPSEKPWDARLAFRIIQPFKDTAVSPNMFTTLRLLVGLASAYCFAGGEYYNTAALLFALSHLLDHTDGELARLTGKTSPFGHYYDLASDALIMILLFVTIGVGLANNSTQPETLTPVFGHWSILMGIIAGSSIAIIFQCRNIIENYHGKVATKQANFWGFEVEDILYLLPLVTIFNGLPLFLLAATIGAPIGAILVWRQYQSNCLEYN